MDSLNDMIRSSDFLLYWAEIGDDEAEANGIPVEYGGKLVAYYYPEKFDVHNCFVPKGLSNENAQTVFNMVASNVAFLNPNKDIGTVIQYMNLLADRYEDESSDGLKISRPYMKWFVVKTRDGEVEPYTQEKTYYWIGKYRYAPRDFKLDVVRSFNGMAKRAENVLIVSRAIDEEQEIGKYFITAKLIASRTGLHINTVHSVFNVDDFRHDIDRYNEKKFKTKIYSTHRKNLSVDRIVQAIDSYVSDLEVHLSKRGIARKADVHYQTVGNLWHEKPVVSAYNRYNEWIVNIKQTA